ncbi:hypothetical protein Cgig2_013607 [Carnegiea gigantea]|uniref:Uncharacterized protein n=1 Tax=Carnegiea gigantea TaxID=171969 RepID=A0A9Q1KCQ9_9CARY|nr:hypothetical protein Cgig2_013607 [Carnegiea gigantea]
MVLMMEGVKQFSVAMSLEGHDAGASSSGNNPNLKYTGDLSSSSVDVATKSFPEVEEYVNGKIGVNGPPNATVAENKGTAKIHDFCFGIPFGGFVLAGGLIGSIFSRNLATLGSGVFFGGAILALSTISLKVWREGKACAPFILGQAVLAASLLWKNFQTYSLICFGLQTKKLFPSGLYALLSAAMLLFYSYVLISGGNPPPKKLKSAANAAS